MFTDRRNPTRNVPAKLFFLTLAAMFVLWVAGSGSIVWAESPPKTIAACKIPVASNKNALPPVIEALLALPDDKIDIGMAALLFDKQARPEINVAAYSKTIDDLAAKVKSLNESRGGHSFLWSMGSVLQKEGFVFDFSPDYRQHQFNHTLSGVLDTKHGFCDSLTALYIAIAQRVGFRPYPVLAPGHIFVRYTGLPGGDMNIDPTSGGTLSNEEYAHRFHITSSSLESGAYLRTLTYHEYLGVLMFQTAQDMRIFGSLDMSQRSKAYYDKAVELSPHDPNIAEGLRRIYDLEGKEAAREGNVQMASELQAQAGIYRKKAEELGFIEGPDQ